MQADDKIGKSSWVLMEGIKDAVATNIVTATKNGQLKVDPATLPALLTLLNVSIEEGYHKGYKTFIRSANAGPKNPVSDVKKKSK